MGKSMESLRSDIISNYFAGHRWLKLGSAILILQLGAVSCGPDASPQSKKIVFSTSSSGDDATAANKSGATNRA